MMRSTLDPRPRILVTAAGKITGTRKNVRCGESAELVDGRDAPVKGAATATVRRSKEFLARIRAIETPICRSFDCGFAGPGGFSRGIRKSANRRSDVGRVWSSRFTERKRAEEKLRARETRRKKEPGQIRLLALLIRLRTPLTPSARRGELPSPNTRSSRRASRESDSIRRTAV